MSRIKQWRELFVQPHNLDFGQKNRQMSDMTTSQSAGFVTVDPCLAAPTFSFERFLLFTLIFLIMLPGSVALFLFLGNDPYGIQIAAVVGYTAAIALYTFSLNRGMPRYLFRCLVVQSQLPRIALRHLMFVAVLFVLLTAALQSRPLMPPSWLVASGARKSMPPLTTALLILTGCLALTEILTNRSLLKRAHLAGPNLLPPE
jgi:hypothetical protein